MAKETPKRKQPFDIFSDDRLGSAMQAATAPGAESSEKAKPETAAGQGTSPAESRPSPLPPRSPSQASPPARATAALPASSIEDHVPLKFEVPRSMRAEFQAFRAELGAALGGVAVDHSNIGRALFQQLLGPDRSRVLEAARTFSGRLVRPRNDDAEAMAAFDHALAEFFKPAWRE